MRTKGNVELKYGLIIGVGVSFWILLEYALGFHTTKLEIGRYSGYFSAIIPIIAYWFAIREKKNNVYGGSIKISQGLKTSFFVALLAGTILGIFMFSYLSWINPDFIDTSVTNEIEILREQGLSQTELTEAATAMLALLSPPVQGVATFLGSIFQGIVIGFIITLIQRRGRSKPPVPPSSQKAA